MTDIEYKTIDGEPTTLDALCRTEPGWAANRIRAERARVAELEAERDALTNLLARLKPTEGYREAVELGRRKFATAMQRLRDRRKGASETPNELAAALREDVTRWGEDMYSALIRNAHKGRSWFRDDPQALLARVCEELHELAAALEDGNVSAEEAADVANMAMMVADAARATDARDEQLALLRPLADVLDGQLGIEHVRAMYRTMSRDSLELLRDAFVRDRVDARVRADQRSERFCDLRIELLNEALTALSRDHESESK
jgi:hypothetical protein